MGGSMSLRSREGAGSTFTFLLRFGLGAQTAMSLPSLPERLLGCRVLVVDDNPAAREILTNMVDAFGLQVNAVSNASDALVAIRNADLGIPYDLVLADLGMPGMNGIELARAMRVAGLAHLPKFILATAFGRDDVLRQADDAPVDAVLFKPVDQSLLHDTFINVLAKDAGTQRKAVPQQHLPRFDGRRVLLVEDNEINQQIAREMLAITGLQVDIAGNGRIAVDRLLAAGPAVYDLVLMDIQMPEMGGHAATRRIRMDERFENLPIVAMTAHATHEEREACTKSGMQDHITKPINPAHFYQTLTRWLTPAPTGAESGIPTARDEQEAPIFIPGFDTADTLERLSGDVGLYHRVLGMLVPGLGAAVEQFTEAAASADHAGMKSVVHNIRGMAANVGATELAGFAAELEEMLAQHRESQEHLARFRVLAEQTLQLVQAALAERNVSMI